MTTEIAIMNASGVALAADSALTVSNSGGKLHYHGIDKIFGLNTYDPVAIMVYGCPDFLDVPWEVIIKSFRDNFAGERLAHLSDYANLFMEHLFDFCNKYFDEERQYRALRDYISTFLQEVRGGGEAFVGEYLSRNDVGSLSARGDAHDLLAKVFKANVRKNVKSTTDVLLQRRRANGLAENFESRLEAKYTKLFNDIMSEVFQEMPISARDVDAIKKIPAMAVARNIVFGLPSGIVIAGYGNDEIHPSFCWYDVNAFIEGQLLCNPRGSERINFHQRAALQSFGNDEFINSFLNGVSMRFRSEFGREVKEMYGRGGGANAAALDKKSVEATFDKAADRVQNEFRGRILSTVALLPKQTLAEIASNLIMLSSIKSHISEVDGSVGGPVSVAVISKGDGLIWINRQHYFDPAMNPHFMARYATRPIRSGGSGENGASVKANGKVRANGGSHEWQAR